VMVAARTMETVAVPVMETAAEEAKQLTAAFRA
jgi:hypothetical protein